jgi:hypothetical protein
MSAALPHSHPLPTSTEIESRERILLLGILLFAFALRVWNLDANGLSYDEAATVMMARAAPVEIVAFHWNAAFEHPPLWQLLMHLWTRLSGANEFALRFLPAAAGTAIVALSWALCQRIWQDERYARLFAALLTALSPTLLLYSQEARMYSLVVAIALALLILATLLVERPTWGTVTAFVLLGWLVLGLHYYSLILFGVITLYFGVEWMRGRAERGPLLLVAVAVAVTPLVIWLAGSPGFRTTLNDVLRFAGGERTPASRYFDEIWRDLSYGSVRWQPAQSVVGYLLLPVALVGILVAWRKSPNGWLIVFTIVLPMIVSLVAFGAIATRYILFVLPLILIVSSLAVAWLAAFHWLAGVVAAALALIPAFFGLYHYETAYDKSQYREMAAVLAAQAGSSDLVLLEGPRQHLLYKVYGPIDVAWEPVPNVELPDFWPINAPPVVPDETDDQIQRALQKHGEIFLVLSAENEVDKGEFVPKYLRAVSFREQCRDWLDVRLCRYRSPGSVAMAPTIRLDLSWDGWLHADGVATGESRSGIDGSRTLPVRIDWRASTKPLRDLTVSLRLQNEAGETVAQEDDLPIGPLLPPSTWSAGDEKPGYFVLTLPPAERGGMYELLVSVYDSVSREPVAAATAPGTDAQDVVPLTTLELP